jgi:hypothetical protein
LIGFGGEYWTDSIKNGLLPTYAAQGHSQLIETLIQSGVVGLGLICAVLFNFYQKNRSSETGKIFLLVLLIESITEAPLAELGIYSLLSAMLVLLYQTGEADASPYIGAK